MENDGHAYTISAPGSSIASAPASRISHDPFPTVTRPSSTPVRSEMRLRSADVVGSG